MLPFTKEEILRRLSGANTLTPEQRTGALLAINWVDQNLVSHLPVDDSPTHLELVKKAIDDTLRETFSREPQDIMSKRRDRKSVYLRSCALYIYQNLTGASQMETVEAFGTPRQRISYVHMRKLVKNTILAYPDSRRLFLTFENEVRRRLDNSLPNPNS